MPRFVEVTDSSDSKLQHTVRVIGQPTVSMISMSPGTLVDGTPLFEEINLKHVSKAIAVTRVTMSDEYTRSFPRLTPDKNGSYRQLEL